MSEVDNISHWAHIMWQRHGMRFSEFFSLSDEEQLLYIASELLYRGDSKNGH